MGRAAAGRVSAERHAGELAPAQRARVLPGIRRMVRRRRPAVSHLGLSHRVRQPGAGGIHYHSPHRLARRRIPGCRALGREQQAGHRDVLDFGLQPGAVRVLPVAGFSFLPALHRDRRAPQLYPDVVRLSYRLSGHGIQRDFSITGRKLCAVIRTEVSSRNDSIPGCLGAICRAPLYARAQSRAAVRYPPRPQPSAHVVGLLARNI